MKEYPLNCTETDINNLLFRNKTQHRMPAYKNCKPTIWNKIKADDRLWVRERFKLRINPAHKIPQGVIIDCTQDYKYQTKPAIHMPRNLSRFTLLIMAVKTHRIQSITEEEAEAEGAKSKKDFFVLWNGIYGSGSWQSNQQVVAMTFEVVEKNIDQLIEVV